MKTHLIHIHVLSVKVTTQNRHWNKPNPRANKLIPLPPPLNILIWIYACTRHIIMIYRKTIKIKETNVVSNRVLVLLHDLHQHSKRAPASFFCCCFGGGVLFFFFFFTNKIFEDISDIFLWSAGSTPASLIRREIPCTFFMNKTQSRDCLCHSNSTENHTVAHKRSLCRRENIDGGKKISLISLKLR